MASRGRLAKVKRVAEPNDEAKDTLSVDRKA